MRLGGLSVPPLMVHDHLARVPGAVAFEDEALYLTAGHQELAHLLFGVPLPSDYASYFSGSPVLYPILGALADTWGALGNFLHRQCPGATAWVLCGNPELTRHLGLRAAQKHPVRNGPIECRWLRYDVDGR